MAPPTRSVPRPWRALAALGVIVLIMLISITGTHTFSPGKWHQDFKVGLGLDLSSGTQATLLAHTPSGAAPSPAEMSQAVNIMNSRVNITGNTGAQVQPQGNNINITVPNSTGAKAQALIKLATTTAQLRFRQVLLAAGPSYGTTSTTTPSASASPSPSATPSTGATPSASPSATSTATTKAKIVSNAATPSPSASVKASPSASASASPSPAATPSSSAAASYYGDKTKVPASVFSDFEKIKCTPSSSPTTVNGSWKQTVGYTDSKQWDDPNAQIVSCDAYGNKYVLDKSVVLGANVKSATAELNSTAQWIVSITLDGPAVKAFGDLTTTQNTNYYSNGAYQTNPNDAVLDQIGMVLDGNVVEAPQTQGALVNGNFQVQNGSTGFTQTEADYIQNVLKYGALPLTFEVKQNVTISPQLAHSSLDAGLIAAAIGLGLVVLYSFFYYRGLGLVSVSSLAIAALMAYLAVVLLTKYQAYTMQLSGIAGLIVAIGITADSFVVFFERLRDEVRDGKALRPAVESGWKRARRTVLVSDSVSFLAAFVLYELAIGEVRGFAYTLGLTTIIDVVVVFLFTKPMVTVLARTKFFSSGHRLSGLDPVRLGARTPWRSSVPRAAGAARTGATRTGARSSVTTRTSPTDLGEA